MKPNQRTLFLSPAVAISTQRIDGWLPETNPSVGNEVEQPGKDGGNLLSTAFAKARRKA
jgi:hypothetical protein